MTDAPPAAAEAPASPDRLPWLGLVATVGLICLAAVHCIVMFSPQTDWMTDPRLQSELSVEVGPTGAAICDLLAVLLLALTLVSHVWRGHRLRCTLVALWIVGVVFALLQGSHDAESLRIAGNWIGATALGLAAMHLAANALLRRLMFAAMIGLTLPLAGEALYQVTVEHAQTVEDYQQHKDIYLRERGWAEGSSEQRQYEERLNQLEATGRFGFSNVFGSVMAALTLLGAGASFALLKRDRKSPAGYLIAGAALLGGVTLMLTFSKGAILALIVASAAALGLGTRWIKIAPWIWGAMAVGVVLLGIVAVIGRGAIGPPESASGERSLLFRYHYWQGAGRMIVDHPVRGVGPGDFQDAYVIDKNPISPEDVTDPHNVFVAWIATLGVGGWAWSLMLLWMLAYMGAAASKSIAPEPTGETAKHVLIYAAVGAGVLAFGSQYAVEWMRYWIDTSLLWAATMVGFIAVTAGLSTRDCLDTPLARLGLFAGALAMALHSQIEMTLTNTMAAPTMFALLGLAAAPVDSAPGAARRRTAGIIAIAGVAVLAAVASIATVPLIVNQSHLHEAAQMLRTGAKYNRLDRYRPMVIAELQSPLVYPPDARRAIDISDLELETAIDAHQAGDAKSRDAALKRAVDVLTQAMAIGQMASQLHRHIALIHHQAWRMTGDAGELAKAIDAAKRMLSVDPYNISGHLLAGDLAWAANDKTDAAAQYRRAIELSDGLYLDPKRQITAEQRKVLEERIRHLDGG
ncbi:MAG: hypothetical protein GC162_03250 [Planctomycetes bacterium]|nr:hypothetical protein [Planctomycetota bacterium]